jgi:hypothetical protein
MEYKIYCKQSGGLPVPLTVRIEWLKDGTIKPCLFWTPDGSCYKVKHIYEVNLLAYLKDGGEGLRFKVRAELIETPNTEKQFSQQYEIYLYFADNWFCGRNMIDKRYDHDGKEFIPVTLDIFPNSEYELVNFKAKEKKYIVEKTIAIKDHGAFKAGGIGIRHKVSIIEDGDKDGITEKTAFLYFEINKWFIEVKTNEKP